MDRLRQIIPGGDSDIVSASYLARCTAGMRRMFSPQRWARRAAWGGAVTTWPLSHNSHTQTEPAWLASVTCEGQTAKLHITSSTPSAVILHTVIDNIQRDLSGLQDCLVVEDKDCGHQGNLARLQLRDVNFCIIHFKNFSRVFAPSESVRHLSSDIAMSWLIWYTLQRAWWQDNSDGSVCNQQSRLLFRQLRANWASFQVSSPDVLRLAGDNWL